jgi:hypothetical protein
LCWFASMAGFLLACSLVLILSGPPLKNTKHDLKENCKVLKNSNHCTFFLCTTGTTSRCCLPTLCLTAFFFRVCLAAFSSSRRCPPRCLLVPDHNLHHIILKGPKYPWEIWGNQTSFICIYILV